MTGSESWVINNRQFHKMLTGSVEVEYHNEEGLIGGDKVWLVNWVPSLVIFVSCQPIPVSAFIQDK